MDTRRVMDGLRGNLGEWLLQIEAAKAAKAAAAASARRASTVALLDHDVAVKATVASAAEGGQSEAISADAA